MLARIIIRLADVASLSTNTKATFWGSFASLEESEKGSSLERSTDELEKTFKSNFPLELQKRLTARIEKDWNERPRKKAPWWLFWRRVPVAAETNQATVDAPKVNVELLYVSYGSLIGDFDITGLTGEDGRALLVALLQIYVPPAFRAALQTNVNIESNVSVPTARGDAMSEKNVGSSNLLWVAANGLLVLPVVFALLVCLHWFDGFKEEIKNIHDDNGLLRTERTKIVDGLLDQNTKLSAAILDHAKASVASTNEMQKLLVKLVNEKAVRPTGNDNCCDKADKGKEKPTNYNVCMLTVEAPKNNSALRYRAAGRLRGEGRFCPQPPK